MKHHGPIRSRDYEILRSGQRRHQGETLVHHADPKAVRVARARNRDRVTVDRNLSVIGVVIAGDTSDQRGLTGSVLSKHGVKRRRRHLQIDILQSDEGTEHFRNAGDVESNGSARTVWSVRMVIA